MSDVHSEVDAQKCRAVWVPSARDWRVQIEQPLVVVPQFRTRYHPTTELDPRIRPLADADYVGLLYRTIEFAALKRAQFCVFPEYSWPLAEAAKVFKLLHDQHDDGGAYFLPFEHMTVVDYVSLLDELKGQKYLDDETLKQEIEEITLLNVAQDKHHGIINVCFVVLQTHSGILVVPQRKLRPARLEEEVRDQWAFVPGRTLRFFESGDGCRFSVLICFDLINRWEETPERPRDVVARERLNYLFVPECNPEPLHDFYFKGAIAMFQSPRWAQHHPIIVTVNVAAGSDIPVMRKHKPSFGFSRLIGRLGSVDGTTKGHYHSLYSGFVTSESPRSLNQVNAHGRVVEDQRVSTLVIRPEQSVAVLRLPTMTTGPTRDASVKRFDTSVKIYRPIGDRPAQWRIVMPIPNIPPREVELEIPEDVVVRDGLVGAEAIEESLREMIVERAAPIRVVGPGGTGKSALVATVLKNLQKIDDDRVIWIDMRSIEHGIEPLTETILRKLGHGDMVALEHNQKWHALRRELKKKSTILVLDGADRAGSRDLTRQLAALQSWKTLVIVVSQLDQKADPDDIEVMPLGQEPFRRLVLRTAQREQTELPGAFVESTYRATGGTALGAVWAGQLMKSSRTKAEALVKVLGSATQQDGLQKIYEWCEKELKPLEREILSILCELPAAVPIADLHLILDHARPAGIQTAVNGLHALGLLIHVRKDHPAGEERLHFRHPFVQQFWRNGASKQELAAGWARTVRWARTVSEKYGREGRKAYYPQMSMRWSNVAHVLRNLAEADDLGSKESFLEIWRNVEVFLWITARWRERLEFGEKAVEFANDPNFGRKYLALQARALYDALGKTRWHRDASSVDAEKLLAYGWDVAEALGDNGMRARYRWYKSRLLLFQEKLDDAFEELKIAEELVGWMDDEPDLIAELAATVKNAFGNVFREKGLYSDARDAYDAAMALIANVHTENADELRDIILRNRGRLELERGDHPTAIVYLEQAMEKFGRALNIAQQAECAVYHARALAGIDELEEAERELDWAETVAATIGSAVVRRQVDRARAELADLRQQQE